MIIALYIRLIFICIMYMVYTRYLFYTIDSTNIVIKNHNGGFFSNCSIILDSIIDYFNKNNKLPTNVDTRGALKLYKPNDKINQDIYNEYFNNDCDNTISYETPVIYIHSLQFYNYKKLNYNNITPFIRKYFSPSIEIQDVILKLENKYNITNNYENICVLFYRGNDKNTETNIPPYTNVFIKANEILSLNPNVKFLIQSDETEFINYFNDVFPTSICFFDEIRHVSKCNSSVDIIMKDKNYEFSKYYLAITIIMSKCKYIVCTTGNCSIWIMLFRGNANNIFQLN